MQELNQHQTPEFDMLSNKQSAKLRLAELNRLLRLKAGIEIIAVKNGVCEIVIDVTAQAMVQYGGNDFLRGQNKQVKFVISKDPSRALVFQDL